MKLYVWEDVLYDYTAGCMFALASSVEEARAAILEACSYVPPDDLSKEPRVVETVEGFTCWGGG